MPGTSIESVTLVAPLVDHFNSIIVGALHDTGFEAPTVAKLLIFTEVFVA